MAAQSLSILIEAIAASLREANQALTRERGGALQYFVSELEASIPYRALEIEHDQPLVDLSAGGESPSKPGLLRVVISTAPRESDTTDQLASIDDRVINQRVEDAVVALLEYGLSEDQIIVEFDTASSEPLGTVLRYRVHRDVDGDVGQEMVLVVSGEGP